MPAECRIAAHRVTPSPNDCGPVLAAGVSSERRGRGLEEEGALRLSSCGMEASEATNLYV